MSRDGDLRASDADREHAVEMLRSAAGEGRLDADELDERVQRALRARTYAELANTVIDLPADDGRSGRRGRTGRRGQGETPAWAVRTRSRRADAGRWAWRTVRANPLLLLIVLPLLAIVATMMLAAAMTWCGITLLVLVLGGRRRDALWGRRRSMLWRHSHSYGRGRRSAWTLSWGGPAQRHRG